MFEVINQPIIVQANFERGHLKPLNFTWRNSFFPINKIVFKHTHRFGRAVLYNFSVLSLNITCELQFNNLDLTWKLLKIYETPNPSC